jgi:DNA-directed RNA polymerase specialized sigma24 family protein
MSKTSTRTIDPYVIQQSNFYALRLIRNKYYPPHELNDLRQEFILFYLKYGDSYDPNRSSFKHFVQITFNSCERNLRKKSISLRPPQSLDEPSGEDDTSSRGDLLTSESPFSLVDLTMTLDRMPSDLRLVCSYIIDGSSIVEVARKLHLSPKAIYKRLKKIRKYFSEEGS